jgi:hypothetical protein
LSPLAKTSLYITSINATAFYNHTEPVGHIVYDIPFVVPPGGSETPRLPVDYNVGDAADKWKEALGGELKLDTKAKVGIKIGRYGVRIGFVGKGIGAKIRL